MGVFPKGDLKNYDNTKIALKTKYFVKVESDKTIKIRSKAGAATYIQLSANTDGCAKVEGVSLPK